MGIKEEWDNASAVTNSDWDNATPINATSTSGDISLMDRIKERYGKVPVSVKDVLQFKTPAIAAGQTIGALGDAAFTGLGKIAGAVTPDIIKDDVKDLGRSLANSQTGKGLLESLAYWKDKYDKNLSPEQRTFLESTGNIASVLPVGKVGQLTASAVAKNEGIRMASDAAKVAKETVRTIKSVDDSAELLNKVKSSFETAGIRPKDKVMAKQFYANSAEAVKDISRYAPEAISKSDRPLEVAVAGVENAKKQLFSQADTLIKEAGSEGIPMNNKKAAIESILSPDSDFATVLDDMPDLRKELEAMQKRLEVKNTATATQLQTDLTHRNSLAASREKFSKAGNQIQAMLADAVRKDLDEGLSALDINGRSDFMKRYGAIKDVEKQFANLAIKEYGAKPFSYLDILSTSGGAVGLATANPSLLLASLTTAGTLHSVKHLASPTRAMRSMFKSVEQDAAKQDFANTLKSRYAKTGLSAVDDLGVGSIDQTIPIRPVTGQRPAFLDTVNPNAGQ